MKRMATRLAVLLFMSIGIAQSIALALDDPMKGPWERCEQNEVCTGQACKRAHLATALVKLYRKYLSPIDGSDCPMYPSCSEYSIASFEKHGLFMGWLMTWDRLYRCGRDEMALSPWILTNGESKSYDPVESNDFWLGHEE